MKIIYLPKPGKREEVVVCTMDITKEKLAMKALEDEILRNHLILQTALNGFFIADTRGNIKETNLAASRITGYSAEELLNMNLKDIDGCVLREIGNKKKRANRSKLNERFERKCRKKNGEFIDIEVSQNFLEIDNQRIFFYFFSDISERKNSETQLRERERELEVQSQNLEEANVALRVLLKRIETDKKSLEEDVLFNIKDHCCPK